MSSTRRDELALLSLLARKNCRYAMRLFLLFLALVPLAAASSLDAGSHVLGGRPFRVLLPMSPASAQAPVAILLHGLGDSGEIAEEMREVWPSLQSTHIVVGPDGPDNMWNVKGEHAENTPDDVLYIGKT